MRKVGPLQLDRRAEIAPVLELAIPFASGVLALAITAAILAATGNNPWTTYRSMFEVAVTNHGAFTATLISATPLVFTGLAAAIAFRMRVWNIGGEGQLYVGAICAAAAGLVLGKHGIWVALPTMLGAGMLGGGLWAAMPGLLRAFLNTNEILTSLMLNYVALLLLNYLIFDSYSYWRDPGVPTFGQGKYIPDAAFWPSLQAGGVTISSGFILGLGLAAFLFFLLRSTRFGFQLRVIADSPRAGRYAGMRTRRMFLSVMIISGALAALAGVSLIGDFSHLLDPSTLSAPAYGYTGIVVAALSRYNPIAVIASAIFLGGLTNAGFGVQGTSFPQGLVGTIEGVILFCILTGEVHRRYRVRLRLRPAPAGAPAPDSAVTLAGSIPPSRTPPRA